MAMRREHILALVLFAATCWFAARVDIEWLGEWHPAIWRTR
jgi:hypothetical protein